jgi:membrane-anchored protein YejM (alkaline phosphatase superfamily)
MDVTATILPMMGVSNPLSDYSQGMNLAEPIDREYMVVSDWSGVSYISDDFKFTLPFHSSLSLSKKLFDGHDNPSNQVAEFVRKHRHDLEKILANASQYLEK